MRLTPIAAMHRSGSSLVAGIANLLGLHLGHDDALMPATEDNPRGYWEIDGLHIFGDELFEDVFGTGWALPPWLPDGWERDPALALHRERGRQFLRDALCNRYGGLDGPTGWKDPRNSILLPFWRTVFDLGPAVLVVRAPDQVIGSLVRRDGLDPEDAADSWIRYVVMGWLNTPGRLVIDHADVHADVVEVAQRLATHLDLPAPTDDTIAELHDWVDPSLRRSDQHRAPAGPNVDLARSIHTVLSTAPDAMDALARRLRDDAVREQDLHRIQPAYRRAARQAEVLRGRSRTQRRTIAQLERRVRQLEAGTGPITVRARQARRIARRAAVGVRDRLRGTKAPADESSSGAQRAPAPDRADQDDVTRRILASTPTAPSSGPTVSAVIPTRNGVEHLRRLMPALEQTAWDDLEVVVVDNGSDDGSLPYLEHVARRLDLVVVAGTRNRTFSDAVNAGVAAARGDLLLLLNNDIVPIGPHWLGHLVAAVTNDDRTAAAGARLLYPVREGTWGNRDWAHPDLTVQHRGIGYYVGQQGVARARNLGAGEDPFGAAAESRSVPGATAACLLVTRSAWDDVGGLHDGYVYGIEDVELCIALRHAGHDIVHVAETTAWHHEFGTTRQEDRNRQNAVWRLNSRLLNRRWGPALYRQVLVDLLDGDRSWSEDRLRVTVVPPAPAGVVASLAGTGANVQEHEPPIASADLGQVIVHHAPRDLRGMRRVPVVVVMVDERNVDEWLAEPSFADADVVVASSEAVQQRIAAGSVHAATVVDGGGAVLAAVRDWAIATRWAIATPVSSWENAPRWGDTHVARALQRELQQRGHPTRVHLRDELALEDKASWLDRTDVMLHLHGRHEWPTGPGRTDVLWLLSHPEAFDLDRLADFDVRAVASATWARQLATATGMDVLPLLQGTDLDQFQPQGGGPRHDVLFVGNTRNVRRPFIHGLLPTELDLAIYGAGWTDDPDARPHVRGEHVANEQLAAYYSAAGVVLNDTWPDMRERGFIPNRIYDALACGARVVSDAVHGLDEELGDLVEVCETVDEYERAIRRVLAEDDHGHAERARARMEKGYGWGRRVDALLAAVEEVGGDQPRWVVPPHQT